MSARIHLRALLALIVAGAALFAFARPAHASGGEDYFVSAINQIRAGRGLGALSVSGALTGVAASWSAHMASDSTLEHNPSLSGQVGGWRTLGENVGTGPDVASIENAFENSPHHFENMVDPSFTMIGVAVIQGANGTYWVTEDFEQSKNGAAPAPAPSPSHSTPAPPRSAPRPAPKPASAPRPAPAPVHAVAHPAAHPATPSPVTAPVATTVAPTPPTVPLAVLGSSAQRPAPAPGLSVASPFTSTNLVGLVALAILGMSMAMFSRVRLRTASVTG